jgi:hypothetical protein
MASWNQGENTGCRDFAEEEERCYELETTTPPPSISLINLF